MESITHKPRTFEERMDARRAKVLAKNRHRTFVCVECNQRFAYDWIYEHGLRCDAGCDGELVEVRNGG